MRPSAQHEAARKLLDTAHAAREAGSHEKAIEAMMALVALGVAEGAVLLSELERQRGNHETSGAWMRKAEELAARGEAVDSLSCHLAFAMCYGAEPFDVQQHKARLYLHRAAELGDVIAQINLATDFLRGSNGEPQDEAEYRRWIGRAIAQAPEEAIPCHVRNMLELGRPVDIENPAILAGLGVPKVPGA